MAMVKIEHGSPESENVSDQNEKKIIPHAHFGRMSPMWNRDLVHIPRNIRTITRCFCGKAKVQLPLGSQISGHVYCLRANCIVSGETGLAIKPLTKTQQNQVMVGIRTDKKNGVFLGISKAGPQEMWQVDSVDLANSLLEGEGQQENIPDQSRTFVDDPN